MSDLLKINVNEHTEKKNNLTYLSWAWAWAEVLKIDPAATWEAHEWNGMPCMVAAPQVAAANSETDEIIPLSRREGLIEVASYMADCHAAGNDIDAINLWYDAETWSPENEVEQEERKYVWGLLKTESKLRTAIKANHPDRKAA
jgi:hypothetical protein